MSVPGTNLETEDPIEPVERPDPADPAVEADDDDPIVHTVKGADGADVVPVATLIEQRKQVKTLKKELEQERAARSTIEGKVNEIMPYVEMIKANPKIIEQAQSSTRPSAPATIQPEDDHEAIEWAQDNGYITATGELDVARARRVLNHLDKRAEQIAEKRLQPLRQSTAQQISVQHKAQAKAVTLEDGTKFASDESIEQAFAMLPAELTADAKVAAIIPLIAAGIDRAKGKSVRASRTEYSEPLMTESVGRRGPAPIDAGLQRILDKTGVSEKDFRATDSKYVPGRPMRLE
jgi:hypothetical protein